MLVLERVGVRRDRQTLALTRKSAMNRNQLADFFGERGGALEGGTFADDSDV